MFEYIAAWQSLNKIQENLMVHVKILCCVILFVFAQTSAHSSERVGKAIKKVAKTIKKWAK